MRGIKPIRPSVCRGCGTAIEQPRTGRRLWCSERCRKNALYGGTCVDCGEQTSYGSNSASLRCRKCQLAKLHADLKVWDRETILDAIWTWAGLYGEPPAEPDWSPTAARVLGDEVRARRAEDPRWPHVVTVFREFGSWNAAMEAAGFEPRARHGGGGNEKRKRSLRVSA